MALVRVSESKARAFMAKHFAGIGLGRRKIDYQNGGYATAYTLNGESVLEIRTDPTTGTTWHIDRQQK